MDPPIKPFKINIPNSDLARLKKKLELVEFPDELPVSDSWEYGVPITDMKRLVGYWREGYDWRQHEAELNRMPQFTTSIDVDGFGPINIHFVHKRSKRKGAIPLIFCHGWPGSFIEIVKILPLLVDPSGDDPAFDVIAPSLPNFGFSEGPSKPGFGVHQYAESLHKLMLKLGYDKYVTQGGDWGFSVTRFMGIRYPGHCVASHLNYLWVNPPKLFKQPLLYLQNLLPYSKKEKEGLARTKWFYDQGYGYNVEQSTRPATIGFALEDSPVALLAWIYEKLHDWTDSYPWSDDEILTWISIYLFSDAGPAASARIYYETTHPSHCEHLEYNPKVKLGLSTFPGDLVVSPWCCRRTLGPVVFDAVHEEGGHFAAYEKPELLVGDLRTMFGINGGACGIALQ
ncbi:epoxide hydrolase [Apodospora peruviana]|uniref:Epoxide hydrolase n=1 Tax=Apodospora peruviana TaxID=516989 RepID=A0AAE0I2W9_9PEZI|nr:epoxide hydrolase [Apodospora peruviana]